MFIHHLNFRINIILNCLFCVRHDACQISLVVIIYPSLTDSSNKGFAQITRNIHFGYFVINKAAKNIRVNTRTSMNNQRYRTDRRDAL